MKIYWNDGALNLMPEAEEDDPITSAILFAFGTRELNLVHRVFEVGIANGRHDTANEYPVIPVDTLGDGLVHGISSRVAAHEPQGVKDTVSTD